MRHAAPLKGLRALARPLNAQGVGRKVVRPHATAAAAAPAVVTTGLPVNATSATGHTPTIDAPFEGSFNVEGASCSSWLSMGRGPISYLATGCGVRVGKCSVWLCAPPRAMRGTRDQLREVPWATAGAGKRLAGGATGVGVGLGAGAGEGEGEGRGGSRSQLRN